jgi:hypothetical protein
MGERISGKQFGEIFHVLGYCLLGISLLWLGIPKFCFLIRNWDSYVPMQQVGEFLHFTSLDFSQDIWRGIWTLVHHCLGIALFCSYVVFKIWKTKEGQDLFLLFNSLFSFWILLNCYRFGTAPSSAALLVNLGTLWLMQKTIQSNWYLLCFGLPSFLEFGVRIFLFLYH